MKFHCNNVKINFDIPVFAVFYTELCNLKFKNKSDTVPSLNTNPRNFPKPGWLFAPPFLPLKKGNCIDTRHVPYPKMIIF